MHQKLMAFTLPDGEHLWKNTDVIGGRSQGSETAFIVRQADRYFLFQRKG